MRISDAEIEALAARLELPEHAFRAVYTRRLHGGELSLRETPAKACIFYDSQRGCSVYEDRPRQCRTWPFWRGVVASRERWDEEAQNCPGMNRGALHPAAAIEASVCDDGTSGRVPGRRR